MQPDPGQLVASYTPVEGHREVLRVHRLTVRPGEDQIVVCVRGTQKQPILRLSGPYGPERGDGWPVEFHRARPAGLCAGSHTDLMGDGGDGLAEDDLARLETTSLHRSPRASPRRHPVVARNNHAG